MVQFELKLEENIVEKWRSKYLDYVKLKKVLKDQSRLVHSTSDKHLDSLGRGKSKDKGNKDKNNASTGEPAESSALLAARPPLRSYSADRLTEMTELPSGQRPLMGEDGRAPVGGVLPPHLRPMGLFEFALQEEILKFTEFYRMMIDGFLVELEKYEAERLDSKLLSEGLEDILVKRASADLEDPPFMARDDASGAGGLGAVDSSEDFKANKAWDEPSSPDGQIRRRGFTGQASPLNRSQSLERRPRSAHSKSTIRRTRHSMRRALQTMYREMLLINNFAILNFTGVIKIIKKANKTLAEREKSACGEDAGGRPKLMALAEAWMAQHAFEEGQAVRSLLKRVERLYAHWFSEGNLHVATGELLSQVTEENISYDMLKLGYRIGVASTLGLWVIWDCLVQGLKSGGPSLEEMPAFPALCGLSGLLSVHWSWAIQVMVWTRYKINYIYLFELDPRYVRSYVKIVNDCVLDTVVFLILTLLYFKAMLRHLPYPVRRPGVFVLAGFVMALYRLFSPWKERRHLWKTIYRVVFCFCNEPVNFFDTYVGDVLTSMVKTFIDLCFTVGFVCSGDVLLDPQASWKAPMLWQNTFAYRTVISPLVVFLPLFWRFFQCLSRYRTTGDRWPHLGNAVKYGAAQLVTIFGAIHPLYSTLRAASLPYQVFWFTLFISSTLISFCWDVFMDWGLGKSQYFFLNDRQMYPRRAYYYAAVVLDLFLRFLWVYSLIPPAADEFSVMSMLISWITPLCLLLEMLRRTIWGFFRLENEHLRNTEGFRRVSVVPLHYQKAEEDEKGPVGRHVVWEVVCFGILILGLAACTLVISSWELNLVQEDDASFPLRNHSQLVANQTTTEH